MHRSLVPLVLVGALAAPLLAGCGDAPSDDDATMALTKEIRELTRSNDRLTKKLEKLERTVSGNSDDIDRLAHQALQTPDRVVAAVADDTSDEPAATMDSATAALAEGGDALAALLASEKGQEVVEKAMAAAQEKRDSARRDMMVNGMVDRFAVKAELTPDQTEKMRDIASRSMTKIREVWTGFREMRNLPAEERQVAMQDNMAKMEEIREDAGEEAKAVLNSAQYLIYEEEMDRMRGGFGGGRGGFGGGRGR